MFNQKALYLIASLAFPLSNYITLPVFIKSASLEEYGYYFLLLSIINMASLIIGVGLVNTINAYYFYWKKTNSIKNNFANISLLAIAQFFIAALFLSGFYFALVMLIGDTLPSYLLSISIVFFSAMLYSKEMLTVFFRIDNRLYILIILNIVLVTIDTSLKIIYLITFEFKMEYYLLLAAGSIFFTYGFVHIAFAIKNCNLKKLKSRKTSVYYRYNLGVYKSNIIGRGVALSDRPFVAIFLSDYDLGLYALIHRTSSTLSSARSLIKNIWISDALSDISSKKESNNNLRFLWGFGLITLVAMILVPFYAKFVLNLSYSFDFFAIVFLFFIINNMWVYYYFDLVFVIAAKKSAHMSKVQLCSSAAYLSCLPLALPFDLYAFAMAQFFQISVMFFTTRYYYSNVIVTSFNLTKHAIMLLILLILISIFVSSIWFFIK